MVAAGIALAACGFQPLYGSRADGPHIQSELDDTFIRPVDQRVGQILRNDMLDLITPLGEPARPRYVLNVEMVESKEGLALERDATVTRFNLTLTANYDLQDARTGEGLNAGTVRATAAYNVLRNEFSNVSAERDAEARAARVVAEEIKTRLSIYFARRRGAP
ncbi:MAG: hypothetical protein EXQ93_05345 [Alphaproteobacteria bacterium]|nr:hypothetical protein [Alphaproteobacteria bacterium]